MSLELSWCEPVSNSRKHFVTSASARTFVRLVYVLRGRQCLSSSCFKSAWFLYLCGQRLGNAWEQLSSSIQWNCGDYSESKYAGNAG